jgi:hypothetical protein
MPDAPSPDSELTGVIRVVKSDAAGAVPVVGLVVALVGVVAQLVPGTLAPLAVMLSIGLVVTVGGVVGIVYGRRRRIRDLPDTLQGRLPSFAYDDEFLFKAIVKGMPPMFIKEVTDESSSQHLLQSDALAQLQSLNDEIPVPTEEARDNARRRAIKSDHRQGDERALARGRSRQLEFLDALAGEPLRAVLTTKTRLEHDGRKFVVGWSIPVGLPDGPVGETICLSEDSGVVRHRLIPVEHDNESVEVDVASSVQERLAEIEAKSRPGPSHNP